VSDWVIKPVAAGDPTPALLRRFSSRAERLGHVFLRDRLQSALSYKRIAGYFRSSIFELVDEELRGVESIQVVCNSDLDPKDIAASRLAREALLKEKWNEAGPELDSLLHRPRYQRLYDILKSGRVEIRVVSRDDAPFLHGKAGVIRQRDGSASAFIGSLNETREGWNAHYEIVWEDLSPEGIAWVEAEFDHLWARGKPLPDTIIEEVGRCARKREVSLGDLSPADVAAASLVEAPLYQRGEDLKPWQRAFVELFVGHREIYGKARFVLADEVGIGKTLSLATSALVACLLEDGPALILCPATLCQQWQTELKDKLGVPSAVWLSNRKVWQDDNGNIIKTHGPEDVAWCPFRIGIVSTGLIFHNTGERAALLKRRYGTLILDEAHRARRTRGLGDDEGKPNNLLSFMQEAAERAKHVLLGTATPIQTHVEELWDLLDVLNRAADHVLGRTFSPWRHCRNVLPVLTGEKHVLDERQAWEHLRNPLPSGSEETLFDHIRTDLQISPREFFTSQALTDLADFTRAELRDRVTDVDSCPTFLQQHNPIVRHTVLRKRSTLEARGLLDRIAVDIWPHEGVPLPMFEGQTLRTSAQIDEACKAAEEFGNALAQRVRGTGFMKAMLLQRICSSLEAGRSTAQLLLDKRTPLQEDEDDAETDALMALAESTTVERQWLLRMIEILNSKPTDPKLDAVLHFLIERHWLESWGCILFTQYHDTARWIARALTERLPEETVALYAGANKSGLLLGGEWRSVEREDIKKAVRDRRLRLLVATDAACEGLNLQTLGTLINIDLPWNPSRLEQRIGRIKRFGQRRERVDMLNLVYQNTRDEKVYQALSRRMEDRYDLFGSLPDTIEDDWIWEIEKLDEHLDQFIEQRKEANAFDLRYGATVDPTGPGWELCERVLARRDVVERLSEGW
jgi:superfamily II DNA or RNA helicase